MANYEATPSPTTTADFPGKTLGIVGLVLAILAPVVGIIVSAIALSQSKKAGFENRLAKIGLIVASCSTVAVRRAVHRRLRDGAHRRGRHY